jgi:hypothetical protein
VGGQKVRGCVHIGDVKDAIQRGRSGTDSRPVMARPVSGSPPKPGMSAQHRCGHPQSQTRSRRSVRRRSLTASDEWVLIHRAASRRLI